MIISNKGEVTSKITYAKAVYGDEEKQAVLKALDNGWLASGPLVKCFEDEVAKLFGKKYGVAVNSGSSANLLALKALKLPEGSEVITPVCTFATTVAEIINCNLVPVFVDSVIGRYTIDESQIEALITNQTKAIMVPQLIGGVCNMPLLRELANKYNLWLIDDSCDTLAPMIGGKTVASYADLTTTSFYGSHIITAYGVGGMIMTNDATLRDKLVTLRDWGRVGNDSENFSDRFDFEIDTIPYDAKFLYTEFGYNLKMNEGSAAFGLEQLKKLPHFIRVRDRNFSKLFDYFSGLSDWFTLPYLIDEASTNWLAFPLTITESAPFTRYQLLEFLESKGIQTRVLFSGNITRHPVYKENNLLWRGSRNFPNADKIMANGFLIGCHHGMTDLDVEYVISTFNEFFKIYR